MTELAEPTMAETGTPSSDLPSGDTILGSREELPVTNIGGADNPWSFDPTALPGDLSREPALRNFDSVDKLAKSYIHANRKLGVPAEQLMRVPQDSSDPAWNDVYNSIGRPETPDGYHFGENYNDEMLGDFKTIAHNLGLNQDQANKILDLYQESGQAEEQANNEQFEEMHAVGVAALQKEWGKNYNENIELSRRAFFQFASKDALDVIEQSGIGNHPEVIKMFSNIGKLLKEDGIMVGEPGIGNAVSPAMAQERINEKLGDPEFNKMYLDKGHPQHANSVEEMSKLFQTAHIR